MLTSDFKYCQLSFEQFTDGQAAAINCIESGKNLIVVLPTGTGKTAVIECLAAYMLATHPGKMVQYVAPLRSIVAEKEAAWKTNDALNRHGIQASILSSSGDIKGRLRLFTIEAFDQWTRSVLCRNMVSCCIVDEFHMLADPVRGAALEAALSRLMQHHGCRIAMLSAVACDVEKTAQWIKRLSGNAVQVVRSDDDAGRIEVQYCEVDGGQNAVVEKAAAIANNRSIGEKVLVFVHSKAAGKTMLEKLRQHGIYSKFHNAGLRQVRRRAIEQSFAHPSSGIDVLVSTSTLASGVNL